MKVLRSLNRSPNSLLSTQKLAGEDNPHAVGLEKYLTRLTYASGKLLLFALYRRCCDPSCIFRGTSVQVV